jgi:hypothetical protein
VSAELTETTVRYLYATTWLPTETNEWTVAVPGGSTKAVDSAGNLLHIAMWNLRRIGAMEFEQLRPYEDERARVLGGRPLVEALRERNDELREARGAYLDAEPGLTGAVMADCLRTVANAFSPSLGD